MLKFGGDNETLIYGRHELLNVVDLKSRECKFTMVGDAIWLTDLEVSKQGLIAIAGNEDLIRLI